MKKLSLLKLQGFKSLKPEDLKRIKGGSCQAWLCQCSDTQNAQNVDNTLEDRDKNGYL